MPLNKVDFPYLHVVFSKCYLLHIVAINMNKHDTLSYKRVSLTLNPNCKSMYLSGHGRENKCMGRHQQCLNNAVRPEEDATVLKI